MKNLKQVLDFYITEYGKGYLLFDKVELIRHYLPGSQLPEGEFATPRKPGVLAKRMEAYFEGLSVSFNDKIKTTGSDFEKSVYDACREIPYGMTVSYKELAGMAGTKAYRAVGSVLARNRLPVIIPCHRVVPSGYKAASNRIVSKGADLSALRRQSLWRHTTVAGRSSPSHKASASVGGWSGPPGLKEVLINMEQNNASFTKS